MDEEKPKKKRKKKAAEGEGGEPKVHKPNWREVYATVEDIKGFLSDHIYLRWNLVKHRVEARLPMEDTFCVNSELAQFVSDDWQAMSDRLKNTLFTALQTVKSTRKTDFETVLDSGYVKGFHPFLNYLNRLPPWDGQDYILELSVSVSVKGGPYGHYTEHMPHVASFCGTGNNVQFLNDATGNRRWLPFPVEKIGSAMKVLGFAGYRSHGRRGYRVVRYKIDEIEANRRLLASDAEPENETAGDSGDSAF